MEGLIAAHTTLEKSGNLSKAIDDVRDLIQQIESARNAVNAEPKLAPMAIAKLKQSGKASFDKIEDDLKEINKGLNVYGKALKDKFRKTGILPAQVDEGLEEQRVLVERAIGMHLLREGKFAVAGMFVKEVNQRQKRQRTLDEADPLMQRQDEHALRSWVEDFVGHDVEADCNNSASAPKGHLQKKFAEMYHILANLQQKHDLEPAIMWARLHSGELENRGSKLEFELARLKFVELYTSEDVMTDDERLVFNGPIRALEYARETFPLFSPRYAKEAASLFGSLAFAPDLGSSPYMTLFYNSRAYDVLADHFTRDFCSLLSLSPSSPLLTTVTAGAIALPTLSKVQRILTQNRGQWTSANELPVETPLPPAYLFHSIFVCPVSKEQATDANPPMLLECGHVIAKESLDMHARGKAKIKCPYCPTEMRADKAFRLYV